MDEICAGTVRLRMRLVRGEEIIMGPGKADLLDHIRRTGSIAAAGRSMGMSYKRAWALVETMNRLFREPLVAAAKGGPGGGGARVTALGETVLEAYRRLECVTREAGADPLARLQAALAVPPDEKAR